MTMLPYDMRSGQDPWRAPGYGVTGEAPPQSRTRRPPRPAGRCIVGDRVEVLDFFLTNQSALRPFHIAEIRAIARRVTASLTTSAPISRILVVGHTDNKGAQQFNTDLGSKRAAAVAARLRTDLGANASKVTITTQSAGEGQPVAGNHIERGRACNRRVEVFLDGVKQRCSGMSFRRFFTITTCGSSRAARRSACRPTAA